MAETPQSARPILIAGGGIGGLAAAIALADKGFRCRVLERREFVEEAGAGIQIGPNGVKALRALGADVHLQPYVGVPDALVIRDATSGGPLTTLPFGSQIERRFGAPYWTVHRADLHSALSAVASRHPGIVLTGSFAADRLEATATGVKLVSETGAEATGAAVIGADGLWSRMRGYVAGPTDARFTGRRAFRTVIPADSANTLMAPDAVALWLGQRCHVVHYPVRGGAEIAVVVVLQEKFPQIGWALPADWADIEKRIGPRVNAPLLKALARGGPWRAWDLHELPPLPAWSNGAIALLGDAAHPMLPFLAQGGVMALEDALTLAHFAAASPGDLPAAFTRYHDARKARVVRVVGAAARNGHIYHLSGPPGFARNAVLRMSSPARLLAHYDWLYGWNPP